MIVMVDVAAFQQKSDNANEQSVGHGAADRAALKWEVHLPRPGQRGSFCDKTRAVSQTSSQQQQFEAALHNNGWQIVDRATGDLEWWADEVWTIESKWRPAGLQAFVTFVVDPMGYSPNRTQGEGVWSVRLTASWPSNNDAEIIAEESLKHWYKKLVELVTNLSRFRNSATTDN